MYNNLDQTIPMHWEICTGTVYKSQQAHNVDSILIQRLDVESMLNRRCFNIVCLLGMSCTVTSLGMMGLVYYVSMEKILVFVFKRRNFLNSSTETYVVGTH